MALEGADFLACFHIPEFDSVVITATDEGFAIRAEAHTPDPIIMAIEGADFLVCFHIPEFEGGVTTATDECSNNRRVGKRLWISVIPSPIYLLAHHHRCHLSNTVNRKDLEKGGQM